MSSRVSSLSIPGKQQAIVSSGVTCKDKYYVVKYCGEHDGRTPFEQQMPWINRILWLLRW